ncbi:MAG: Tll0287-like domain-containing protein [Bacteroidota bacterium]
MARLHLLSILLLSLVLFACDGDTRDQKAHAESAEPLWVDVNDSSRLALGDSITDASQKTLLGNVKSAMQRGGPPEAVEYCNLQAMPLTDSLSKVYGVTISRISERNRNPDNTPNDGVDKEILQRYHKHFEAQQALQTRLVKGQDDQLRFYKPIFIGMPTCLKCHGDPNSDIAPATLKLLDEKYPQDEARGYKQGDLRGMWKVTFKDKKGS